MTYDGNEKKGRRNALGLIMATTVAATPAIGCGTTEPETPPQDGGTSVDTGTSMETGEPTDTGTPTDTAAQMDAALAMDTGTPTDAASGTDADADDAYPPGVRG